MNRLEAAASKFAQLAGGGPTQPLDYDYSGQILAAADLADAAAKVHRVGLDEAALARTAERSWEALSKRDKGRSWSQIGTRGQALWLDNVRNILEAAADQHCECLMLGCRHQSLLTEEGRLLVERQIAERAGMTGGLI